MAAPTILVTGASGFVGRRLCAAIRTAMPNAQIVRADRTGDVDAELDITNADAVNALVARAAPTTLFHLAAIAAVSTATNNPAAAWAINRDGAGNVMRAALQHAPDCHFIFVSTAEVYGASFAAGLPVAESAPLRPLSEYAKTKAAAEDLLQDYVVRGLFATTIRPFNHTGPGQTTEFVIPAFASQIAECERGLRAP